MLNKWHRRYAQLETDPTAQWHFHKRMVRFWLLNFLPMNLIVAVDIWAIMGHHDAAAALTTAVLLAINTNYSLYANFDTEFGDAHSAYTAMMSDKIAGQTTPPTSELMAEIKKAEGLPPIGHPDNQTEFDG